jgi:copper(I)-binding protein
MQSVQDATRGQIGDIVLGGVAIHAPTGQSYAAGSTAQMSVTVVNNGNSADTLVNVTSPAFSGWAVVDNAAATSSSSSTSGGDTGLTIEPGSAQRLGLAGVGGSAQFSPRTLVLRNLSSSEAPLFPGTTLPVTFRFANAGSTTLSVPVQLTASPGGATVPVQTGTPAG